MNRTRTIVRVAGKDYTIRGAESAEYIHRVAIYVDRRMQEIGLVCRLPDDMIPVLTAINVADELFKTQDELARLRKELAEQRQENVRLQKEVARLREGRNPNIRRVETRKQP